MTALFPIPASWAWTTLGEIAEVVGGVTKDTKKQSDPALPEVPYLRVANVQRGYLDLREITKIRVPESVLAKLRLLPGDVLLNEGGDRDKLGRGWIWDGQIPNCIHQNHVFRARLHGETALPRFLALYINDPARQWFDQHAAQSVNLASISLSTIKQLPVPLPPLGEQHRIVATLDDHLSRLDAAASNVNKAAAWVMQLRRSIYSYVASGRIMLNADNDYSTSSELVSGWTWVHPDDVTSGSRKDIIIGPFGSDLRVSDYKEDGIPLVFVRNIRSGTFGKSSTRYISQAKADELRAHQVTRGDVLITKMGEPPGDSCVYTSETPGIITADCIRLRPGLTWDPRYLSIAINSPLVRPQIARITRGIAQRKVSLGRFRAEVKIPVPPPALQSEVVDKAEQLLSLAGSLEAALVRALKRRDSLRRALLAEAFTGRLVPQDTTDEPAALLLDRIQSRRALQPAMRRGRGTAKLALQEETLL